MAGGILEALNYYLAEQPVMLGFRWSNSQTWGSTWSFLVASIILYLLAALAVHLLFFIAAHARLMLRGRRLIGVGVLAVLFGRCSPLISFLALLIPALHSLLMAVVSAAIFLGLLFSSAAEIRDTRWLWGRSKTPLQWLFCFPLGTRPTGRVFFWSYLFYLSRFLHLPRALFSLFMFQRRRRRCCLELYYLLFHYPIAIFISFLWLEFSQSFQVVAILCTTLLDSLLYGCRLWVQGTALLGNIHNMPAVTSTSSTCCCCCCFFFPPCIIINIYCRMVFLVCNLLCHLAVLLLHFSKGGCNGIRAWAFNSILHDASLLLFIKCYVNKLRPSGLPRGRDDDDDTNHSATTTTSTRLVAHKQQ